MINGMRRRRPLDSPIDPTPALTAEWDAALAYRPVAQRGEVAADLTHYGIAPDRVREHLLDGGATLWAAAQHADDDPDWAEPLGGPLAVTLLAREVMAYLDHMQSLAAEVRGRGISALLQDFSAVTVAEALRVSRPGLYGMAAARAPQYGSTMATKVSSAVATQGLLNARRQHHADAGEGSQ